MVGAPGHILIEAAGRALLDLRLWRDGTDLVPIDAETRTIEPTRSHPLTDFLIAGTVEPGTYLVTAYGGAALAWPMAQPRSPSTCGSAPPPPWPTAGCAAASVRSAARSTRSARK